MLSVNGGFLRQPVTGVQRYGREILKRLIPLVGQDDVDILVPGRAAFSPPFPGHYRLTPVLQRAIWTQTILPALAEGTLLSLANIGPLLHARQILCIHDLNTLIVPESYKARYRVYQNVLTRLLSYTARRITTVSDFSRTMLEEHGLARGREISVIPNGHEHVLEWDGRRSRLHGDERLRSPFVFVVGSRAQHKNVGVLLQGAAELARHGIRLVVAGGSGPFLVSPMRAEEAENITTLGFVTDDDLAFLFSRAECFVFPSLTEGFGLPVLEAMALDCPVITSTAASLPEVCGDAAVYVDPTQPAAWIAAIQGVASSRTRQQSMRDKGRVRAKLFSWDRSAELYRDLVIAP